MPIIGSRGVWQGQERLNDEARRVVQRAEALAASRGLRQGTIDVLLLSLLSEEEAAASRVLAGLGIDTLVLRDELNRVVPEGSRRQDRVLLDAAAREAVVLGANEARRGGFDQAGAGHILLGIFQARAGVGARLLREQGVRVEGLREAVQRCEMATEDDGGSALFSGEFRRFLAQIGEDGSSCPRCSSVLHTSFSYCYSCGAALNT